MKTIRAIAEVRVRLEEAVAALPGLPTTAEEVYDRYEQIAIAILDSEDADFAPGLLQEYLECLLYERRLLVGLPGDREL
jgi:hypothetical protein